MTTDRLGWTIERKQFWIATHRENGVVLVARTKSDLMSNINCWEKAEYDQDEMDYGQDREYPHCGETNITTV